MKEKRIVIIEDEIEFAKTLKILLEKQDYIVTLYSNPDDILSCVNNNELDADVLLIDFRMAGINTNELIRDIRKLYPELRMIIISGIDRYELDEEIDSSIEYEFLQKPFTFKELLTCLKDN